MKKAGLLIVLTILLTWSCVSFNSKAAEIIQSGTCDNGVNWTFDVDGTMTFLGTGEIPQRGDGNYQDLLDGVIKIVIEEGITGIGENAFANCESLTEITIPGSVEKIEANAFKDSGLTKYIIKGRRASGRTSIRLVQPGSMSQLPLSLILRLKSHLPPA